MAGKWEWIANADCGTGAGGFKSGNTCAKGGKSGAKYKHAPSHKDREALIRAVQEDSTDVLSRRVLADVLEEQGGRENIKDAKYHRDLADKIDDVLSLFDEHYKHYASVTFSGPQYITDPEDRKKALKAERESRKKYLAALSKLDDDQIIDDLTNHFEYRLEGTGLGQ